MIGLEYVHSPDESLLALLARGTETLSLIRTIGAALICFFESESESDSEVPDSGSSDDGEAFFWVPLAFTFVIRGLDVESELELELELEDAMDIGQVRLLYKRHTYNLNPTRGS